MRNILKTEQERHQDSLVATNNWLKSKLDKELLAVANSNKLKVTLDESNKYEPVVEKIVEEVESSSAKKKGKK